MPPKHSPAAKKRDKSTGQQKKWSDGNRASPARAEESFELSPLLIDAWRAWLDQGPAIRASLRFFTEVFDEFDAFLDTIEKIKLTYIVGQGDSLFVGQAGDYFARYLEGWPTIPMSAYEFLHYPPPLSKNTLVIAISASGRVKSTVDAVQYAKSKGAPVLGITENAGSPLAHSSSFFLTPVINENSMIPLNSTTASMALLFIVLLFVLRGFRDDFPPELEEKYNFIEDSLNRIPTIVNKVEDTLEGTMQDIAETVAINLYEKNRNDIHYVGTGPGQVTATIGAAKIKELCYYHSEATELEEFAHYQKLLLSPGDPVFLISPGDFRERRIVEYLKGFNDLKAQVYWFTSPNLFRGLENKRFPQTVQVVQMPEVLEVFQPLVYTVPLQVFALYFTIAIGQNPTTFRSDSHLNFVNIYARDEDHPE